MRILAVFLAILLSTSAYAANFNAYTDETTNSSDDEYMFWDSSAGGVKNITYASLKALINSGMQTALTDAQIKAAYENNADTNALSDALLTKLNAIEAGATADLAGNEIAALLNVYLGTTDWQTGGAGGVSQLDALEDVTGVGTTGYLLQDDGDGTFSFRAESAANTELDGLTDITGTGTASQVLMSNGDGTYSFADDQTGAGEANVQVDFSEEDTGSDAYILNRPTTITTEQASAISTNTLKRSYPVADESKLAGIEIGAEVNVITDFEATSGDAQILNLPTTLAGYGITDAATATQGATADTALQPADIGVSVQAYSANMDTDSTDDLTVTPVASSIIGFNASSVLTTYAAGDSLPVDIGVDASGFNGNLTTSDDTIQKVADAVDGLATGGTGAVDSVFGRTGTVTAQTGDYNGIYEQSLGNPASGSKVLRSDASGNRSWVDYVWSFDGRTGQVVPAVGDYSMDYITLQYDDYFEGFLSSQNSSSKTVLGLFYYLDQNLGSAAALNVGIGANQVVQLDSNGDLPFAIGVDASGFNGNLTTTDDTIQKVAQKLDDLTVTGGTDDQTAAEVPITDSGGYFTGTDVEAALQEIGAAGAGGDNLGTATATDVSALFSGTGDYLKSDGTKGTPAGGTLTITEQSSDPSFSNMSTGDLIVSTASGDLFYKSATGGYTLTGAYTADPVTYTLTVTDPGNNDVITCSDTDLSQAINCGNGGTDCTATAADGASITGITATAATGRQFDNWTGDVTGSENPTTTALVMSGNKAVQGVFSVVNSSSFVWSAATTAAETPSGKTGEVLGVFTSTGCQVADCYDSNGGNYARFPIVANDIIDFTNFDITFYFNPQTLSDYGHIFGIGSDSDNYIRVHTYSDGSLYFRTKAAGVDDSAYIATSGDLTVGTVYKLRIAYVDGVSAQVWLDDVLKVDDISRGTMVGSPTYLYFASDSNAAQGGDVIIDEVVVQ